MPPSLSQYRLFRSHPRPLGPASTIEKMEPIPEDHHDHNLDHSSGSEGSLESYNVDYCTSNEEDYLSQTQNPLNPSTTSPTPHRTNPVLRPGPAPVSEPAGGSQEDEGSSGDTTSDPQPGGSTEARTERYPRCPADAQPRLCSASPRL